MKALSIHQPWAWAILQAGKDIENRSWSTNYRGPLLIHASKSRRSYDREKQFDWRTLYGVDLPPWEKMVTGALIGIVDLVDCLESDWTLPEQVSVPGYGPNVWAEPHSWCWVLSNPRVFHEPVPFRGLQQLFEVPDEILPGENVMSQTDREAVACPQCHAQPGEKCKNYRGVNCAPHGDRRPAVEMKAVPKAADLMDLFEQYEERGS